MPTMKKPSLLRRMLGGLLMTVFGLLMIVVFCVAVVLGDPQPTDSEPQSRMDQPLVTASPAVAATTAEALQAMLHAFPAPVLYPVGGGGLTILSGTSYDAAFENGFGRILTLRCATAAGQEITLTTIYPARALALLPTEGYALSAAAGHAMAGMRTVRMEHAGGIRLHAQGHAALYAVDVPPMEEAGLIDLTRLLRLYEGT